jgi:hypothetical protein
MQLPSSLAPLIHSSRTTEEKLIFHLSPLVHKEILVFIAIAHFSSLISSYSSLPPSYCLLFFFFIIIIIIILSLFHMVCDIYVYAYTTESVVVTQYSGDCSMRQQQAAAKNMNDSGSSERQKSESFSLARSLVFKEQKSLLCESAIEKRLLAVT